MKSKLLRSRPSFTSFVHTWAVILLVLGGLRVGATDSVRSLSPPTSSLTAPALSALSPRERLLLLASQTPFQSPPLILLGEVAIDEAETQELLAIYDQTTTRYREAGLPGDRRNALVDWSVLIEEFLTDHPQSAYFPGASLQLAAHHAGIFNRSAVRQHAEAAWLATRDRSEPPAARIARDAAFRLGEVLVGDPDPTDFDAVYLAERERSPRGTESRWSGLIEHRNQMLLKPNDVSNCGVKAMARLHRAIRGAGTSMGGVPRPRTGREGIDAASLARFGAQFGLSVRVVRLADLSAFPSPSIMHQRSEHFVAVVERRGDFYQVIDPGSARSRWLTARELAGDASGVLLIAVDSQIAGVTGMQDLSDVEAATYRGRNIMPSVLDQMGPSDDLGCPAHPGQGAGGTGSAAAAAASTRPSAGSSCGSCGSAGMPVWEVDEPTLNIKISDTPLVFEPKYGPPLELSLTFHSRRRYALVGSDFFLPQGRFEVGPVDARYMLASSWMSWVEYDSDPGLDAYVYHPGGGMQHYAFGTNNLISATEYWSHSYLEKRYSGTNFIGLRLHHADGRQRDYLQLGQTSGTDEGYYLTALRDSAGFATTLAYHSGTSALSQVTAADGTIFTIGYGTGDLANAIISVTSSVGVNAYFGYDETPAHPSGVASEGLSSITDVAGIQSYLHLIDRGTNYIRTPYGRTAIHVWDTDESPSDPIVYRGTEVWHPTGGSEAFALLLDASAVVPAWAAGQIPHPTNAIVATMDTADRGLRNTYHWPTQARSVMTKNLATADLDWSDLRRARSRHWLLVDEDSDYFETLSWEQEASPDGSTEGAVRWYDYEGKTVPEAAGTESYPAVEAQVMPDGTTWYREYTRNSLGKPLSITEHWDDGGSYPSRTETFTYAANGIDLLIHTNALAIAELKLGYDSSHRVIARTNALGEIERFGYDSNGRMIGHTNAADWRLVRTFSTDGLTVTSVAYLSSTAYRTHIEARYLNQSYTRTNLNGGNLTYATRQVVETDERGLVTTNIFDPLGRIWERRQTGGLREQWHYELNPGESYATGSGGTLLLDLTARVNALGQIQRLTYDGLRRLTQTIDTRGTVNRMTYCDCGSPATVVEAYGSAVARTTSHEYDFQGKRWKTTTAQGSMSTNHYDLVGRLVLMQDPFGWSTNQYDNLGRLEASFNAAGTQVARAFDVLDRILIQSDANGTVSTNTFDNLDRLLTTRRAGEANARVTYAYTAGYASATSETDALGNARTFVFDRAQRKTSEVQVGLWTHAFTYYPSGDLQYLDDGRGNRTEWKYDVFGRMTEKWYQGQTNADLVYSYDALGRLSNRFSRTGNPGTAGYDTVYSYDAGGSLTGVTSASYSGNVARTYAYDALGRLASMVDAVGTTSYSYGLPGNGVETMAEDGPWSSDTVTVTHLHGLRSEMLVAQPTSSFTTTYGWDASRRMTSVTGGGQTFAYVYPGAGRLIGRVSLPGGPYITNTFDSLGRQNLTELRTSGGSVLNLHGYVYDTVDRRTRISRTNSANTSWSGYASYGYDAASQLVWGTTTNSSTNEVTGERVGYVYDASQNLTVRTNNTTLTGFTNNVLNQLTSLPGSTRTHDRRGNLITEPISGGSLVYAWDDESQLTSVRVDPAAGPVIQPWRIDFVYDGLRRMRRALTYTWNSGSSSWTSVGETRYLYDAMLIVQERSSGNTPQVHYTRGLDLSGTTHGAGGIGGLLMRSHSYSAGSWSSHNAYHSDANGNVTALVNSSGSLQANYKYNPYGGTISSSGTLVTANVMRFSSKPAIFSSTGGWGMYYYGYRFYDPATQRWLNRDPIGEEGGLNLHCYVRNNSANSIDALGLMTGSGTLALEPTLLMSAEELAAYHAAAQLAARRAALAAGLAATTSFCPKPPEDPCQKRVRLLEHLDSKHKGLTGKIGTAVRSDAQQDALDSIPGMNDELRKLLAEFYKAAADCSRLLGKDARFNDLRSKLLLRELQSIPKTPGALPPAQH